MKRITIFLSAVLLVVALAVPAFATETYTLSGEWVFNDTVSAPTESWDEGTGKWYYEDVALGIAYDTDPIYEEVRYYDGTISVKDKHGLYVEVYYSGAWKYPHFAKFHFGEEQEVSPGFYNWVIANASPAVCDGSTCPATDANADGVCDDCGMVLSLRLTGYPTLPIVDGSNQHSVLTSDSGGYSYYVYYSPSSYTIEGIAGDQLLAKFSSNVNWKVFRCTDGRNWAENASSSGYQYGMGYTSDVTILSSSFDFYDESGNLFFPLPLWVEMGQMTEGEMGALTTETAGTMRVLAVCGVGLIALLAVLSLFGKRSLISRN